MANDDTKAQLQGFVDQLTAFKAATETSMSALIKSGLGESDTKVENLKKELEKCNASLASMQQQMAVSRGVPGLAEDLAHGKTKFSLLKAIKAMYREANRSDNSIQIGVDPWADAAQEKEILDATAKVRASGFASEGQAGGYLIGTDVMDVIKLVYAAIPLLDKLPVTKLEGLVGEIHIPKLTAGQTAYQVGENQEPTVSALKYGEFIGRPRRSAGLTFQSKTLIYQSRGTAEQVVKDDLIRQLSRQIHKMLLSGSGNNYQPKGLLNWLSEFTGGTAGSVKVGTNGGRFTITDAALMRMAIEVANEGDDAPANYGYLMRPEAKYGMMTERAQQFSGQATKAGMPVQMVMPLLSETFLEGLIGNIATTTQIPNVQTKAGGVGSTGGSLSSTIYGNWKYFYTMFWDTMSLRISDQAYAGGVSAFSQNGMFIIAEQNIDCAVVRGTALTACNDAETDITKW